MWWIALLACGSVKDNDVLAELEEDDAARLCVDAAPEDETNCGTPFDLDACAADVLATPDSCGATVEDWRACRTAYDEQACETLFELPDACVWSTEEACIQPSE